MEKVRAGMSLNMAACAVSSSSNGDDDDDQDDDDDGGGGDDYDDDDDYDDYSDDDDGVFLCRPLACVYMYAKQLTSMSAFLFSLQDPHQQLHL
ncbi:hypothetical protein DPMN_082951 [Dreissena polymorpha]|uniref:Uncharacterized protein n=1 Tax=Dreissena polymorpha TaxID=45954 RepID=A0A9D3YA75_DREPO|nr:hypothetical protein DPMN_082951 [Dreissena polymorpha]